MEREYIVRWKKHQKALPLNGIFESSLPAENISSKHQAANS